MIEKINKKPYSEVKKRLYKKSLQFIVNHPDLK